MKRGIGWHETTMLMAAIAVFATIPPTWVERLPSVCLNRHIFGFCPACGSLRALVHLFHGDLAGAVRFNPNALLTGPFLVAMLITGLRRVLARPV
jgi:hypothetical protein